MKFLNIFKLLRKNQQKPEDKPILNGTKILIADDVAEIREFIRIILEKAGAEITSCENGKIAMEKSGIQKYDIILLDINMPEIDGCEIARSIRSESQNKSTPLIALTASGLLDLGNKHTEAGFDDYIEKPVRPQNLIRKINLHLLKEKQAQAAQRGEDIESNYKDDPDYKKTIERFIDDLPEKINQIQDDFNKGDLKDLASKLHSLKGMGGMAGFPVISDKAGQLEEKINHKEFEDQIQNLKENVNELILLCRKTRITKK